MYAKKYYNKWKERNSKYLNLEILFESIPQEKGKEKNSRRTQCVNRQ